MQAKFKTLLIPLSQIDVEGRIREDLGAIEEFAERLRDDGLLQPIVVELLTAETITPEQVKTGHLYKLIAGGRRFSAFTLLNSNKVPNEGMNFADIPAVLKEDTPQHMLVKLELEENLRRKSMTWQETVQGIVRYHKACKRAAAIDGEKWSQEMTGQLLGMNQAKVSIAFTIVEAMKAGNEKVAKAESLNDAVKAIAEQELDELQAEQMRRIQAKRTTMAVAIAGTPSTTVPTLSSSVLVSAERAKPDTVEDKIQITKEQIAAFYLHGDSTVLLRDLAKGTVINHIITDAPYAIDTENMVGDSIERIAATHKVEPNLDLIHSILKVGFEVIAPDGFMCTFYDLDHHEKIAKWAEEIGWRVCRWPFIWCKTSPCRNSQAGYNITKSTEVCYILRRSEMSVIKQKRSSNYLLEPSAGTPSHPFVKPKRVWDWLLETVSLEGQTIVDPFAGEGSCLAAAFQSRRVPFGIEIDEKHIASGLSYIQEQVNKRDILDDILMEPPL